MREPAIMVGENDLVIHKQEGSETIPFEAICALIAYKKDKLTTDLVCLDIVTTADGSEMVRTVHEDMPGFEAFVARFQVLPGFDLNWREAVIPPPFAGNRTTVYRAPATKHT
jgi:hypothetical protein